MKCVAELEEHERFRKEIMYSASISYTDNTLNHQMLINSGKKKHQLDWINIDLILIGTNFVVLFPQDSF